MDFWTRLIGGSGAQKRRSTVNDPQQRLARFKRAYNQILHTWHKSSSLATDTSALETIRTCFQRLTSILTEESRSPAPHLCLSFASSSQIFSAVSRIASTSHNESLVREAVAVFSALIDSEEEEFLANERFAEALMTFLSKIANSHSLMLGEDTDAEIVELLFGICAKIRLESEILPVWFSSRPKIDRDDTSLVAKAGFAGVTQKEAFPLCYQLIDHVHHEGRIGDFARTGLLYIFETASKSADLEKWIVESDLATLMASGLGALYSQLSRKLSVIHPERDMPVILALSDYPQVHLPGDAESVYSPEFRTHMDTFLSYLAFWQDVLEHCRSFDVRQTLIDHFQVLFLQQLLYPSLLESSDIDGGSSVAVLTYLRRILDALDHQELVHMILRYLLDLPEEPQRPRSPQAARRRSTLMLMAQPGDDDDRMNPSLFNLVDLLLNSTQSKNPQTVISALKLVTVILSKNHKHAIGTLLNVTEVHIKEPQRTIGALDAEIESYFALAENMIPGFEMDREYEQLLKDALNLLESHPCSLKMLALNGLNLPTQAAVEYMAAENRKNEIMHYLSTADALFKALIANLSTFFTNNVEANLSLTEVIMHLASCPNLRLEGWLAVEPSKYQFTSHETFEEEEDETLRNIYRARRKPTWTDQHAPALLAVLQTLHEQLDALRGEVPNFDHHVANRKQAFRMHDEINEAMKAVANFPPPPPVAQPAGRSSLDTPTSGSGWRPQIGKHVLEASSRSQSPRGRMGLGERRPTTGASPSSSRPPPVSRMNSQASKTSGSSSRSRAISSPAPMPSVMETANMVENSGILTRVIRFPLKLKDKKDHEAQARSKADTVAALKVEALEAVAEEPKVNGHARKEGDEAEAPGEAEDNSEARTSVTGKNEKNSMEDVSGKHEQAAKSVAEADVNGESVKKTEQSTQEPLARKADAAEAGLGLGEDVQKRGVTEKPDLESEPEDEQEVREASLSHILTNVIILQEFVLELVAILQVRASLFQEVRFV